MTGAVVGPDGVPTDMLTPAVVRGTLVLHSQQQIMDRHHGQGEVLID